MNVGPPAMRPAIRICPQDGTTRPTSGAATPKPSVALCSANPTMSAAAMAVAPDAAEAPIARPSPKLCAPIPTAMSGEHERIFGLRPRVSSSASATLPNPTRPRRNPRRTRRPAPPGTAASGSPRPDGLRDRNDRVLRDLDDEIDENPDRERVEQRDHLRRHAARARDRQAEEDRKPAIAPSRTVMRKSSGRAASTPSLRRSSRGHAASVSGVPA